MEDQGYVVGKCSHAYRSVAFEGRAEFVDDVEQRRRALGMMVEQMEPDPEPLKRRLLEQATVDNVVVLRLRVESMTGKKSPGSSVWQ